MRKFGKKDNVSDQHANSANIPSIRGFFNRHGRARSHLSSSSQSQDVALRSLHDHEYVICISDRVKQNEEYPFVGREKILKEILEAICTGNSVLVVGDPGVGKKTLSLGLARELAERKDEACMDGKVFGRIVYTLSLGTEFWNAEDKGGKDVAEIERKIREVFTLVTMAGPEKIVLCIDDVDVLSFLDGLVEEKRGAGPIKKEDGDLGNEGMEEMSTENMLRHLLFTKRVLCLCTCIKKAYERLVEEDSFYDEKFTSSFRVVYMDELSLDESIEVVIGHRIRIERMFNVIVPDESVRCAVGFASNYISHRALPENALDLLCEASKAVTSQGKDTEVVREGNERCSSIAESGEPSDIGKYGQKTEEIGHGRKVVERRFVDDLIIKWCGVTRGQLDDCLRKLGLDAI